MAPAASVLGVTGDGHAIVNGTSGRAIACSTDGGYHASQLCEDVTA